MSKEADSKNREVFAFDTLKVSRDGAVLFVKISAPPMNLLGPELVRDLVLLIQRAEADNSVQVLVFKSADPDYFIAHVDITRVKEYRDEAAKLTGEASIGMMFRYLSNSRLATIAQIEGRVRGAGSEFVLACDMRFAARESATFGQFEPGFGQVPGGGAVQHLVRLMGRSRALEVLLSAEDCDAELAERYGWINRALPRAELDGFVSALAQRIAGFPAAGRTAVKERVNSIALAPADDYRRDSDLFAELVRTPEAQRRIVAAMKHGFQTRDGEMNLGGLVGGLEEKGPTPKVSMSERTDTKQVRSIVVEHIRISSRRPFEDVRQRLEGALPKLDASIADALHRGDQMRAGEFEKTGPKLSIFEKRDHGSLLEIFGGRRNAMQYEIGNPLTASTMTRHQLGAALYAPLRVVLFEDEQGRGVFEYDKPSSFFGQYCDERVTKVGRDLDAELEAALHEAAD